MAIKPSQRIRKVWLPTSMKDALYKHAWDNHTKPSPVAAGIIEQVIQNPDQFRGKKVPPAGKDYLSVYVSEETWAEGLEAAATLGTTLSALVRVGIAEILANEGIPWDASTPRPRNEVIPVLE